MLRAMTRKFLTIATALTLILAFGAPQLHAFE
jgi:hypothetical protein